MAHTLTETSTFTTSVTVPDNGDNVVAADMSNAAQPLANRTKYLKDTTDSHTTTLAGMAPNSARIFGTQMRAAIGSVASFSSSITLNSTPDLYDWAVVSGVPYYATGDNGTNLYVFVAGTNGLQLLKTYTAVVTSCVIAPAGLSTLTPFLAYSTSAGIFVSGLKTDVTSTTALTSSAGYKIAAAGSYGTTYWIIGYNGTTIKFWTSSSYGSGWTQPAGWSATLTATMASGARGAHRSPWDGAPAYGRPNSPLVMLRETGTKLVLANAATGAFTEITVGSSAPYIWGTPDLLVWSGATRNYGSDQVISGTTVSTNAQPYGSEFQSLSDHTSWMRLCQLSTDGPTGGTHFISPVAWIQTHSTSNVKLDNYGYFTTGKTLSPYAGGIHVIRDWWGQYLMLGGEAQGAFPAFGILSSYTDT